MYIISDLTSHSKRSCGNLFCRLVGVATTTVSLCFPAPLAGQEVDPFEQEMKRWEAAEKEHLARLLELDFEYTRSSKPRKGQIIDVEKMLKYPEFTLSELARYKNDESSTVRADANGLISLVANDRPPGDPIRKIAVRHLVEACFDPEGVVWQHAASKLLRFEERDFPNDAWEMLGDGLVKEPVRDDVILVAGVANLDVLDKWLAKKAPNHFNAALALARMGDDEAARRAVEHVDGLKDENLRVHNFLKKLAYTRHPIALEYIAGYLDREDGEIRGNDYHFPPFREYALTAIATNFPDCPVRQDERRRRKVSPDADFEAVKTWVSAKLQEAGRQ